MLVLQRELHNIFNLLHYTWETLVSHIALLYFDRG